MSQLELPINAAPLLAQAFEALIGRATPGGMAYCRALPANVMHALVADTRFQVGSWQVAVVAAQNNRATRCITADQAVEWREDKAEAALFLVDVQQAGAGMDGIYSAAREVSEAELFAEASSRARDKLPHGFKGFAQKALAKARRLARRQTLSPWHEFSYLCRAVAENDAAGSALPTLGLWPIAIEGKPDEGDLDRASRVTERLLPLAASRGTPEARVAALKLPESDPETTRQLTCFLREAERLTRREALALLESDEALWLNRLQPGVFDEQTLRGIVWLDWRGKSGKPAAWSGLSQDEDDRLSLILPLEDHPQKRAKLEVRWQSEPETLAKGSVDYLVEVRAGEDVLAERTVTHAAKSPQKCVFTQEDFGELEESARFEAQIVIRALGAPPCEATSEDFILCFGEPTQASKSSVGQVFETMALAAISVAPDLEQYDRLASSPGDKNAFCRDAKGFVTVRCNGKVARVLCPKLLQDLAQSWVDSGGVPVRWRVQIRADGTPADAPQAVPIAPTSDDEWGRFLKTSQAFASWMAPSLGPLAVLYDEQKQVTDYVNAAIAWWEVAPPRAALAHTLEVVSLSKRRIGLIVLPTHPLLVAWQQGFDMLARRHRYEEGAPAVKVAKLMAGLAGAQYPAMLPGFEENQIFVFADSLGFHGVALTDASDPEPKASVALMSRLLAGSEQGGEEFVAPSVGKGAADVLGEEIGRYIALHPDYHRLRLHALRAGDAMPVARALGRALRSAEALDTEDDAIVSSHTLRAVELGLYSGGTPSELSGRFIAATAERRRSGAGAVPEQDRWMLESVPRPGNLALARLAWARHGTSVPETAAHLAVAFDIFQSRIECWPLAQLAETHALEVHGLALTPVRRFETAPIPRWVSVISPNQEGEKHPSGRGLTERLLKAHAALLGIVVRRLGAAAGTWPVLVTEVSDNQGEMLAQLHRLCDWVITLDRHAGLEYFDSPKALPQIFDAYLIDCVPERDDLGFLQLITSTSSFDEVRNLLDATLGEMGLSVSPRNCEFILGALKSVSGRLALRLAGSGNVAQELIALALTQQHCRESAEGDLTWPSLREGFFVPLDDVPELFRNPGERKPGEEQRADLLYVTAGKRGGLKFSFVEVKFRRYLKTARSADLLMTVTGQLQNSCKRWEQLFGANTTPLEKTLRRASLARILRFYLDKAQRHGLPDEAFMRIQRELEKLAREVSSYALQSPDEDERARLGFVFCPEYSGLGPALLEAGDAQIWLFGPGILPVSTIGETTISRSVGIAPIAPEIRSETFTDASVATAEICSDDRLEEVIANPNFVAAPVTLPAQVPATSAVLDIRLGLRDSSEEAVNWRVSIQSNPHLLMVGLPGMGKTTCLINLCEQLEAGGVAPIVFSYHQDIDEKLGSQFGEQLNIVRYAGLGFNPMQVVGDSPLGYVDNCGTLRDIFAAIFPDLGDVQLGRIREALKTSYTDCGWGPGVRGELPHFRAFYDQLKSDPKPDKGLLARLGELDDYGLFDSCGETSSLLDMAQPTLIQIHGSTNEVLQRAFASFVLYNLYQGMFRRGLQTRITHAIVFDEAHRAAKLRLIPTMAKECRKYGIAFVVASQEAKDFDSSLFTAVASYLALRLNEADAKLMAKIFTSSDKVTLFADRIKQIPKYKGWFYAEGMRGPANVALGSYSG